MNDAVDRLILERGALDRGFSRGLVLSIAAHGLLVAAAVAGHLLFPKRPALKVALGFAAVPLPPGGGGPASAPSAPEPPAPKPEPPASEPEKAPKIVKPPKEEKKGLPAPDAKKARKPATATPAPAKPATGVPGGTGTAAQQFDGLDIVGPPGPGFGGTDPYGDYYMASVKRKIWNVWRMQAKIGMIEPIIVRFTILADGSVAGVEVTQPSSASHLNTAAQSAVITAAPFSPLPKHYETDRKTVDALFRPQQ